MDTDIRKNINDFHTYICKKYIPWDVNKKYLFCSIANYLYNIGKRDNDMDSLIGSIIFFSFLAIENNEELDIDTNEYMKLTTIEEYNTYNSYIVKVIKNALSHYYKQIAIQESKERIIEPINVIRCEV